MSDKAAHFAEAAAALGARAETAWPRLWEMEAVPRGLWEELGAAGLLGLSTPVEHGGEGMSVDEIARVSRALVRASGSQGLATTVQAHNLMADWILGHFASPQQQAAWFPKFATGAATLAFAVSEPGAGAHPKKLSAVARRDGDDWLLSGRKAYVTNGPMASVFCIVAITAEDGGRKRFGAFLVPRETPGLEVMASEEVRYLKPSGHASLAFEAIRVPDSARLTDADDVYPLIVRPLRDHEDAAGAWSRLGAYERLAAKLAGADAAAAGGIAARLRAMEFCLERDPSPEGLLAARAILADAATALEAAIAEHPDALGEGDRALARDLAKLGEVAKYVVQARFAAFGRSLLN